MSTKVVVVGGRRVILDTVDPPDWEFWLAMPTAELWQAVALACDADPKGPMPDIYADRLEIAKAHAQERGFPLADSSLKMGKPETWRVRLADFSAWADGMGWKLPAKFPRPKEQPPTPDKSMTTTERNTLLTIIAALCNHSAIKPDDRGAAIQIAKLTEKIGAAVSDDTVRRALAKIPNALESRMK